jgi:acetylornithine deacetylase
MGERPECRHQAKAPAPVGARFHPPFTTLHVGRIQGGTADNITAADCRFAVEMRCVPDDDPEAQAGAFRAAAEAAGCKALKARRPEAGSIWTSSSTSRPAARGGRGGGGFGAP